MDVSTYLHGRTPNPCVICNRRVKFRLFYRQIEATLRREGRREENNSLCFATCSIAFPECLLFGGKLR